MAELLEFSIYTRRFGLFKRTHLDKPVVYPIARLQLPKNALLHFAPANGVTVGPEISDPLLRTVPGVIYVDHVIQYHDPIGNPLKAYSNPQGMITDYRRKNRAFRPLKNLERLEGDVRVLPLYNYAILSHIVKYAMTFRSNYYMWFNVFKEVVNKVNELGAITKRKQFIEIDLPNVMPSLTNLREFMTRQDANTLKHLNTPEALMIGDLFKWAGPQRRDSLLGKIDPKYYDRVNLIFRRLNGWTTVNLKWLDDFINSSKEEVEAYNAAREELKKNPNADIVLPEVTTNGIDQKIFQLKLLKMLNQLHQATSPIETPTKEEVVVEPLVEVNTVDAEIDDLDLDTQDDAFPEEDENANDELEIISRLEKELEDLEIARKDASVQELYDEDGNVIETKTINIDVLQSSEVPLQADGTAMLMKADELSRKGFLTRAEHNRLVRLSEAHKNVHDPYGSGMMITEAMQIDEKDLIIDPPEITNDKMVLDRSMLHSRVDEFDRQYVQKVLRKDILRCVMAMQKSPVAITGYTIETETDAVTDNEIHIVKFTPAVGQPSTVRFPIPRIRPNGTFLYKGTEYNMRKQRVD